jgi:GntR family transcriptional regulator, transcriptional repressor for pyruvate dehydrogenase complex
MTTMGSKLSKAETPMVANALQAVREMLSVPAFIPGGRLPSEVSMAERLGVSRPVLRQALAVLKTEGVITSTRGSGTYVRDGRLSAIGAPASLLDLENCMRFRMIVECAASAEAARNGNAAALKAIRAALEAQEASKGQDHAVIEADMAFHMAISRATRNRYHVMTLEFLQPHILLGLKMARQMQAIPLDVTSRRVFSEHRAIFDAIRRQEEQLAAKRMNEHLSAGIERIFGGRTW